nr:unnamed protein product [Callosobruchus analis]
MDTRSVLILMVVLCAVVSGAFGAGRYVPKWKKQVGPEICAMYQSVVRVVIRCKVTAIDLENACASWVIMVTDVTGVYLYRDVNMDTAMRASNASVRKVGMDSSALNQSAPRHAIRNVDIAENQASAGVRSAGGGKTARNAFRILGVSMVPAGDRGNAIVKRAGEECFAMKTMRPYITSAPTSPSNTTESLLVGASTVSIDRENKSTTTLKPTTEVAEEKPSDNET